MAYINPHGRSLSPGTSSQLSLSLLSFSASFMLENQSNACIRDQFKPIAAPIRPNLSHRLG
jgi:hypothetical protein